MKNKLRSYGFWTALASALVVLINAIGRFFNFSVQDEIISNIVMAVAGVLVVCGVVVMPKKEIDSQNETEDAINETEDATDDTEVEIDESKTKEKSDEGETEEKKAE